MSTNSSYSRDAAPTSLGQRKVAIPRLPRSGPGQATMKDRRRVPRACTACRSHKIKCTGERPRCRHCATTNRECVYIMPRKDRLKIITERCHQMAGLLMGLRMSANTEDDARIAELLEAVEEETSELKQTKTPSNPDIELHTLQDSPEFCYTNHQQDLDTESLDLLDEDLHNEQSRPTGFVGKSSECQWLRAVAGALTEQSDENPEELTRETYVPSSDHVNNFSYWADGEHVDVDFFVDAYELPQAETAERLLQCYMARVHDSFPILPRKTFEDQFRVYFRALQNGKAPRLSSKWQSILNMVFAIGARHSHLVKASWRADERDHLIYQARARTLGLDECTVTSHSDVPQIQRLGLLGFYWLSTGQVSRAWTVIGIALRSAYSLGLHVRNEDPIATATKRETLVRTWWSLYSLERTLSIITGRPSIIVDCCCSVPLPMPIPEDTVPEYAEAGFAVRRRSMTNKPATPTFSASSKFPSDLPFPTNSVNASEANSGSYFRAGIQLSIITHNILTSLYSVGTMSRLPNELQQDVFQLGQQLEQWATTLPSDFNFQELPTERSHIHTRERMLLAFQFCSAKMLLTRPYLTKQRQLPRDTNEDTFGRRMANGCVEAAKTMVYSLPVALRPETIYDQGPWWCIVHHLMQAISVFLLGLSFPTATSQESVTLVLFTKKAIGWLQAMQEPTAERAYHIALNSLASVAYRYSIDISDIWPARSVDGVIAREQLRHYESESSVPTYMSAQFVPMAPPSSIHSSMANHTAYETTAGFGLPLDERSLSHNESYMVR